MNPKTHFCASTIIQFRTVWETTERERTTGLNFSIIIDTKKLRRRHMCEILEEKQSNQERELNFEPVIIDYSLFLSQSETVVFLLSVN